MKRDMDLVRQILMVMEDHEHGFAPSPFEVAGYTEEVVGYHLTIMGEAGLVEVEPQTTFGSASPTALAGRITWEGHEFLANVRNETVWSKVKSIVVAKGGSVSFEVLKFLVVETAKSTFLPGHPTLPQP
ncbi:MAG: DUF2513 domain-containing protein [Acidobacteriota bacterium]